jgi:hypothetical protein
VSVAARTHQRGLRTSSGLPYRGCAECLTARMLHVDPARVAAARPRGRLGVREVEWRSRCQGGSGLGASRWLVGAQHVMGVASDLKGLFEGAIEWFLKVRRIAPASHSRRRQAPGVRPTLCFVVGCAPRWCACVGLWGSRPSKRTRRARSSSASSTAPAKARCLPPHAQSHMHASAYARMHPADLSTCAPPRECLC